MKRCGKSAPRAEQSVPAGQTPCGARPNRRGGAARSVRLSGRSLEPGSNAWRKRNGRRPSGYRNRLTVQQAQKNLGTCRLSVTGRLPAVSHIGGILAFQSVSESQSSQCRKRRNLWQVPTELCVSVHSAEKARSTLPGMMPLWCSVRFIWGPPWVRFVILVERNLAHLGILCAAVRLFFILGRVDWYLGPICVVRRA